MTATLPVYQLQALTKRAEKPAVFFLGPNSTAPHLPIDEPYRSDYYKIGFLHFLLHETAPIYSAQRMSPNVIQTRSQLIAAGFRKLVNTHYATERSLAFSTNQLCITPKHLAETVREATGKRVVAWLAEAVLLAVGVLLQNPALTIGQIADTLHFADQSTFGQFFRNNMGVSPVGYRQRSSADSASPRRM